MTSIGIKCSENNKWADVAFNAALGISQMVSTKKVIIVDTDAEIEEWRGITSVEISKYFSEDCKKIMESCGKIVAVSEVVSSGLSDIGIARALSDICSENNVYIIFKDER